MAGVRNLQPEELPAGWSGIERIYWCAYEPCSRFVRISKGTGAEVVVRVAGDGVALAAAVTAAEELDRREADAK